MTKRIPSIAVASLLLASGCGLGLDAWNASGDDTGALDDEDDDGGSASGGGSGNGNGSGAGSGSGDDTGMGSGPGGDDGSGDTISVTGISPDYGTTAGGLTVEITGGPFDASATVLFGTTEGSVISTSENTITARTPAVSEEALVDVTVRTTDGQGTLDQAFVFWADGTGKAGAIGEIIWTDAIGSYWQSTPTSSGFGVLYFIAPQDIEWYELYSSSIDTCRNGSYQYSGEISLYDPQASSVTLSGSRNLSLSWQGDDGYYLNDAFTTSNWASNLTYQLDPMSGSYFPQDAIPGFAQTPPSPTIYSPALNGSTPPNIAPNPTFSWQPVGADWVHIMLSMWNAAGTGYQETIHCIANDDGSFRVDTGQFTSWSTSRQLDVRFGHVKYGTASLPWNNAEVRVASETRVYGAGFTSY